MISRRLVVLFVVALLSLGGLSLCGFGNRADTAADKAPPAPFQVQPSEFECRWANGPIVIDGKGDDKAWQQAQVIDNFYVPWLKPPRAAKTATKAKLLWDREYVYFFAEMEDTDLYADVTEHDSMLWDNDVFELFFKPAKDKPGYYEFQVNAAGAVLDMFLPRRGAGGYRRFKSDGDFHVDAKVVRRGTLNDWRDKDEGWSVEGRIPWKDFLRSGGRPEPGEKWQFNLARYDYSVDFEGPELSTCAPLKTRPDFHHFEEYATLTFVGPAKEAARPHGIEQRVELKTSTVVGSPEPPLPYRVQRVYPKLKVDFPITVVRQPGTDELLYITEPGPYSPITIRRTLGGPESGESEALLSLDGVAYDIIFHPDFANNGQVFVGWNGAKKTKVTRYIMSPKPPYRLDPASEKVIIEWPSDGHNGGAIAFGLDGMFYVTSGDGTSDSDTNVMGQGLDHLLAKVLRIDVDRPEEGKTYSVPKDNPFVGVAGARPETWAYGLRNPWRMTVDRKTGHVWVGNNGQDLWEQAYLVHKGDNFGWSVREGSHPFYVNRKAGPTPFVLPTVEHHHSEMRSLTGGIVYYGAKYPDLQGAYLYGDYSTGQIFAVKHDGTKLLWHRHLADTRLAITGFGVDPNGEILICDFRKKDGGFYTLEPTPKDLPPSTFPRKLSDSGLFQSVKGHAMAPALIPYSVNAPLWSDGAHKERWIALPGAEPKIDFTTSRGWTFPDKTVLVKSFALEMEEGNPASRRWIETRFLTNQQGEWFGYSYLWNDEQTDGTLVDRPGTDRDFTIKVPKSGEHPEGTRVQKWHYPSRQECMVCHSRAANYVLGLTELQMNKEHDYHGVKANQLRTLEHLGVLRVNWADEAKRQMREEMAAKGKTEKEIDTYMHVQTDTRDQRAPVKSTLLARPPEQYRALADPYDPRADLNARARSYLHANCAQCHVEAGGGNAQFDVEFTISAAKMKLLDVKPVHHTFDLPDARLIAPGHPERSVLLRRVAGRAPGFMPPLATSLVDRQAVQLLQEWIKQLPEKTEKTETK